MPRKKFEETQRAQFKLKLVELPHKAKSPMHSILDKGIDAKFKKLTGKLSEGKGCYIFGIRTPKGITPVYVGRTTAKKGFVGECFNDSNKVKISRAIGDYEKGTPIVYLVHYQKKKGPVNQKAIDKLEVYLTNKAEEVNPDIANQRNRKEEKPWRIEGLDRAFKKMLGITSNKNI